MNRTLLPMVLALALALAMSLALGACKQAEPVQAPPSALEEVRTAEDAYFASLGAFLEARGQLQAALGIDSLVRARRYPGGLSYRDSVAVRADALMMAMDGLTPEQLRLLGSTGIDVLGSDWTAQPAGRAATAELVVIAHVARRYDELMTPGDGFRSSVELRVEEVLKGALPPGAQGRITVRRRSGLTPGGRQVDVRSEYGLTPGTTYLLFLSNALYDFRRQQARARGEADPDEADAGEAVPDSAAVRRTARTDALGASRSAYFVERYQGTRIAWFSREELAEIKAVIQHVGEVVEAAQSPRLPPAARTN